MKTQKKRGRPPKPPAERRSANITFRTPGGLRERLEGAAKISGRSVSEEVVYRLERSFERQGLLREFFALTWGKEAAELMVALQEQGILRMKPSVRAAAFKKLEEYLVKILPEAPERKTEQKSPDELWEMMKVWADQGETE